MVEKEFSSEVMDLVVVVKEYLVVLLHGVQLASVVAVAVVLLHHLEQV